MALSCESVARHILPVYRSYVAKELITNYKLNQNQAAEKLGTTQAAISQYVHSKRGVKGVPDYVEMEPLIQAAAAAVAKRIATSEFTSEDFNNSFCGLCNTLRKEKKCR